MIEYQRGGSMFIWNLLVMKGSVFPKALVVSLPCALITAVLVFFVHHRHEYESFKDEGDVMLNNAVWGGFSFFVGFLIVFRTSQSYLRFWEGCTATHKMGVEWFDACALLIAFSKASRAKPVQTLEFQNVIIRLFSMLHAAALGDIEDSGEGADDVHYSAIDAFHMELLDPKALDEDCLASVRDSNAKVEMIFQWVQQLIVENISSGVMCIPPPLLTRAFQELATGMVYFHDALKISTIPFPFPYAQTCDALLLMHWLMVPFVCTTWVRTAWWAALFSFVQVFTLWTLNLIAVELENPFGRDPNDMDGLKMQQSMNNHLRLLLSDAQYQTPGLKPGANVVEATFSLTDSTITAPKHASFTEVWEELHLKHGGQGKPVSAVRFSCHQRARELSQSAVKKKRFVRVRRDSLGKTDFEKFNGERPTSEPVPIDAAAMGSLSSFASVGSAAMAGKINSVIKASRFDMCTLATHDYSSERHAARSVSFFDPRLSMSSEASSMRRSLSAEEEGRRRVVFAMALDDDSPAAAWRAERHSMASSASGHSARLSCASATSEYAPHDGGFAEGPEGLLAAARSTGRWPSRRAGGLPTIHSTHDLGGDSSGEGAVGDRDLIVPGADVQTANA